VSDTRAERALGSASLAAAPRRGGTAHAPPPDRAGCEVSAVNGVARRAWSTGPRGEE